MTACVNKRRALAAALAGVLALGGAAVALPAVALAEGASAQVASAATRFSNGSLKFNEGSYTATGHAQNVTVTVVTADGLSIPVTEADNLNKYSVAFYKADADGEKTGSALSSVVDPGTYVAEVTALSGDYAGGVCSGTFVVDPAAVGAVALRQGTSTADNKAVYTGYVLDLDLVSSAAGTLTEGTDYTIAYYRTVSDRQTGKNAVEPENQGKYYATIEWLGKYAGNAQTTLKLEVDPLNLADVTVEVVEGGVTTSHVAPTSVYSIVVTDSGVAVNPALVQLNWTGQDFTKNGVKTGTATGVASKNVTGSASVSVVVTDHIVTFTYDGSALADMTIDASKGEAFEAKLVQAYSGSTELERTDLTVTEGGAAVTTIKAVSPFKAHAVVAEYNSGNYTYYGVKAFVVNAVKAVVDADSQVYLNDVNNKAASSISAVYGEASSTGVYTLLVKYGNGTVLQDFTATLKDSDGDVVASKSFTGTTSAGAKIGLRLGLGTTGALLDAGTYTLELSRTDKVVLSDTIDVVIKPFDASTVAIDYTGLAAPQKGTCEKGGVTYVLAGTGTSAVVFGHEDGAVFNEYGAGHYQLSTTVEKWDSSKSNWVAYMDSTYAEGLYRVTVAPSAANTAKDANYTFAGDGKTVVEFSVVDYEELTRFADVYPTEWWYGSINDAVEKGLMNGYQNSKLFGPSDSLTRGQAAIVLYNLATADGTVTNETKPVRDAIRGYITGFSDVDGNAYYAKAISWAEQAGIVTGYEDGTGTFGPDDTVTREQLAAMIARYAAKVGEDTSAGADLSVYTDAASVDGWAESAVEYCVSADIMGQNTTALCPTDNVTRAEAAAMFVRFANSL